MALRGRKGIHGWMDWYFDQPQYLPSKETSNEEAWYVPSLASQLHPLISASKISIRRSVWAF